MAGSNATFIKVNIGAKVLIGELSNSLNSSADILNTSSKASGRVSRKLPGRVKHTLNFESLADDTNSTDWGYGDAHTAQVAGTSVSFTIKRASVTIATGAGYITSLTKDNPDNDKSTFSGTISVTGGLA